MKRAFAILVLVALLGGALFKTAHRRSVQRIETGQLKLTFEASFRPIALVPTYLATHIPDSPTLNNVTDATQTLRKMQSEHASDLAFASICKQAADLGELMRGRIQFVIRTEQANSEAANTGRHTTAIPPNPLKDNRESWQREIDRIEAQLKALER